MIREFEKDQRRGGKEIPDSGSMLSHMMCPRADIEDDDFTYDCHGDQVHVRMRRNNSPIIRSNVDDDDDDDSYSHSTDQSSSDDEDQETLDYSDDGEYTCT